MKCSVLVVAPYLPLPANFGGAIRIYQLIKGLAERCEVSLLAPGSDDELAYAKELGEICNVTLVPAATTSRMPAGRRKRIAQLRSLMSGRSFVESAGYNPQIQTAIDRLFMTRRIDLVQLEFPESALYQFPDAVPVIFDAHNVEHDFLARVARTNPGTLKATFNQSESRKLRRLERAIWDRATLCLATSEADAGIMGLHTSTPVDVIPNGVDLDYFSQQPPEIARAGAVAFTGAMRHQPNADAAVWYGEQVHERVRREMPEATFSVVGADPPERVRQLASDSVTVTGEVDDIRRWLADASVVAVPLHSGGGTRLKILEAFAAGRPVVSTTLGAEGLDVADGVHLLLADTPEMFANAVALLLHDPALSTRLTGEARRLVESRYDWNSIFGLLLNSHQRAIEIHANRVLY